MSRPMTKQHPRWKEFCMLLQTTESSFQKIAESCDGKLYRTIAILKAMRNIDINASLKYFREHGGYCDCEIIFNVIL